MKHYKIITSISAFLFSQAIFANPYWNPDRVPKDSDYPVSSVSRLTTARLKTVTNTEAIDVLRIQVDWQKEEESWKLSQIIMEPSGTPAFLKRATQKPRWGSYLGILKDIRSGKELYYDATGTGSRYRKLVRAVSFRFPVPNEDRLFELYAENPDTGVMEKVVSQVIQAGHWQRQEKTFPDLEIRELSLATQSPSLRVNIYADGYPATAKDLFWQDAIRVVKVLKGQRFPGVDAMSFYAVFSASNKVMGKAVRLGFPVPEYDTFLGLYYPYWDDEGRWYDAPYPSSENKFRTALATAPYDYTIVLENSALYWGVGTYSSFAAIPAHDYLHYTYLLMHEFGHYFGLNEEYDEAGSELQYAPGMVEPWSQNQTFFRDASYRTLKWKRHVDIRTALPTPGWQWRSTPPLYGVYEGGYGGDPVRNGKSYKPGYNCVMTSGPYLCDICKRAIAEVERYSLGNLENS